MTLSGVLTALVTPFYRGEVDYAGFEKLLEFQLQAGVDGFVINGTTGESPTLQIKEVEQLFALAKTVVRDRVPLLLGTGSNCTQTSIENIRLAAKWGADAALVVVPYYNKPPQRGLVAHFKAIADASAIPIVLYNVPSRTITALSVESVAELAEHPRIIGIKEASGDLNQLKLIKKVVDKNFILLSGDDATCVEFCSLGGVGVISVASHVIGRELKDILHRARAGDRTAIREFNRYAELLRLLYVEANPIPVKAAMFLMKLIQAPEMRLPLVALGLEHMDKLKVELGRLGKAGE
jgi:4-hydroxy-tetrahydrodipicolinate synthase